MNQRTRHPAIDTADSPATSRLAALRAHIADRFARDIAAATPWAREILCGQIKHCADTDERVKLQHVEQLLAGRQEQLPIQVARSLGRGFDAKLDCPEDTVSHTGQFSAEALMLIEELGMQEEFEIEQCVDRLREHCRPQLSVLTAKLCILLGRDTLPESRNPLFPRVLLRSFKSALGHVGGDTQTRRIAFNAYRPRFPALLTDVYTHACALLADIDTDTRTGSRARSGYSRINLRQAGSGNPSVCTAMR